MPSKSHKLLASYTQSGGDQGRLHPNLSTQFIPTPTPACYPGFPCPSSISLGFPGGASGKEPARQQRRHKRRSRFDPWVGKIAWRRT